jgi:hypothetical protein
MVQETLNKSANKLRTTNTLLTPFVVTSLNYKPNLLIQSLFDARVFNHVLMMSTNSLA